MQPQQARQEQKPRVPAITSCVNPECQHKFLRMGEGHLSAFDVSDPVAWGLPEHVKQKVVWICEECSQGYYVRLDRRSHSVKLVRRAAKHRAA